ncbi:MAG: FTR1 family protein [Gemmataceae bacterium]
MLLLSLGCLLFAFDPDPADAEENTSPRLLVHLLDYLAKDYPGAVSLGRVLDEGEYREQVEFSATALAAGESLSETSGDSEVGSGLRRLRDLVSAKADPEAVSALARTVQARVLAVSGLEVTPPGWPSLLAGKGLFAANCSSCHGAAGGGDGPLAAGLNPRPANFLDPARMDGLSPFRVYNTIRLGVLGTGMPAFQRLPDKAAWDLAFYVMSLRHQSDPAAQLASQGSAPPPAVGLLKQVATLSDNELLASLPGDRGQAARAVSALRVYSEGEDGRTWLRTAQQGLTGAETAYAVGDAVGARASALRAYLDGVEPVEQRLKASDPGAVTELEGRMARVRIAIEARSPVGVVRAAVHDASEQLLVADDILRSGPLSPALTFLTSAGVMLREGFEAVLLIIALLGVVRAAGARRAAASVHAGWVAALGFGAVAWVYSGRLVLVGGFGREMLEGVTSLVTVVILLFVGFWLHTQTEARRWKACVESRVGAALRGKNLLGLAAVSFFAVSREALETVLFLRAVTFESGDAGQTAMAAGVAAALATTVVLTWAVLRWSARIPIRTVFTASAAMMAFLAVVLTGKGLHAMQETGLLPVTAFPVLRRWEFVGMYPTLETVVSQLLILVLGIALWHYGRKAPLRAAGVP